MTDSPRTAVADPAPAADVPSPPRQHDPLPPTVAAESSRAASGRPGRRSRRRWPISGLLRARSICGRFRSKEPGGWQPPPPTAWLTRPSPGNWRRAVSSTGLSKKEAKALAAGAVRERVPVLAEQIAARVAAAGNPLFASVEAVNGYVNIAFDSNAVAAALIGEVLARGPEYGQGAPIAETVMVEHSQPNTHKAFHVGHLRNSVLGVAISNILRAAGYDVKDANYIGDIGMHVVKCLWCYERFHRGEEPASPEARGRWLGEVYAESDARLNFRKDVLDFLQLLAREDQQFVDTIDRMLKYLWRKNADGEDIAYLLGRIIHAQPIKDELLRQDDVIPQFWPIVGDQLRAEVEAPKPYVPVEGEPEPTMTPEERLARWESLAEHMDEWWAASPGWRDEVRETFARWEAQEPEFVALWQTTRDWSMADFRRIFAELGAHVRRLVLRERGRGRRQADGGGPAGARDRGDLRGSAGRQDRREARA